MINNPLLKPTICLKEERETLSTLLKILNSSSDDIVKSSLKTNIELVKQNILLLRKDRRDTLNKHLLQEYDFYLPYRKIVSETINFIKTGNFIEFDNLISAPKSHLPLWFIRHHIFYHGLPVMKILKKNENSTNNTKITIKNLIMNKTATT